VRVASPVSEIASAVESLLRKQESPVVVALDGCSAAGKSSLAEPLATILHAAVLHCDDFYRDMRETDRVALTAREGIDRYFDWERLRDEALVPLSAGRPATFCCFDWAAGSGRTGPTTVDARSVLIVEGVYSARPEFEQFLHLKVLVEALPSVRKARQRLRHGPHEWEGRWDAAERIYFNSIRPRASFDRVVSGSA
jgi:uridine kinase